MQFLARFFFFFIIYSTFLNFAFANNHFSTSYKNDPFFFAQELDITVTVPNAGDTRFSVCDGERKVKVKVQNIFTTPLTNVKVRLNISTLTGFAFTGTLNRLSGTDPASTVSVFDANTVTMSLSNLAVGEELEFEVGLRADCPAVALATGNTPPNFNTIATFTGGDGTETENSGNFEVVKPSLSITNALFNNTGTNIYSAALNSTDTMNVTVVQAGDGTLSDYYYWVEDHPNLTLQALCIGNLTIPLFQKVGNISYFKINPTHIALAVPGPNTNSLSDFQFNEQMKFKEIWKATSCVSGAPQDTKRGVYFGCGTANFTDRCEQSQRTAGVTYGLRLPQLVSKTFNYGNPFPACYIDNNVTHGAILYNTGNAPAVNICFGLQTGLAGGNPQKLDLTKVFYKIKSSGIFQNITPTSTNPYFPSATSSCHSSFVSGAEYCLAGVTLNAGDTLFVKYDIDINGGCSACDITHVYTSHFGWQKHSYQDACQINTYQFDTATQGDYTANMANLAEGPLNITNNQTRQFKYSLTNFRNNWLINNGTPNTSYPNQRTRFVYVFDKGLDFAGGAANFMWRDKNGVTWTPTSIIYNDKNAAGKDSLIVNFDGPPPAGFNPANDSYFCLNFKGDCAETGPACSQGGTLNIAEDIYFTPDRTCTNPLLAVGQKVSCTVNLNIDLDCPSCTPCAGISSSLFEIRRSNFGKGDNNNNLQTEAGETINPAQAYTFRAISGDTLRLRYGGRVSTNATNTQFEYGYVNATFPTGYQPINPLGAIVRIYRGATIYNASIVPQTIRNGNMVSTDVSPQVLRSLGNTSIPSTFNYMAGDSIYVESVFKTTVDPATINGIQQVEITDQSFLSRTPFPTATADRYNCYDLRDRISIIGYQMSHWNNGIEAGGCNPWGLYIGKWSRSSIGTSYVDYFPFEHRENPKKLVKWCGVKPSSFRFAQSVYFELKSKYDALISSEEIPYSSPFITVTADTICIDVKGYMKSKNLNYQDEGNIIGFAPRLLPSCTTPANIDMRNQISYKLDYATDPNVFGYATQTFNLPNDDKFIYTGGAVLNFTTSTQTQTLLKETTCFIVTVSNPSANPADYSYFKALSPSGGIIIKSVKEVSTNTTITPSLGIYKIGTVAVGTSRQYEVCAESNTCGRDSIVFESGWSCETYPPTVEEANCRTKSTIYLVPEGAELGMIIKSPIGTQEIDLCGEVEYVVQLSSAKLGYLNNINTMFNLPKEMFLVAGSFDYAYPVASTSNFAANTWKDAADPTKIFGNTFRINVSQQDPVLSTDGMVGVTDLTKNFMLVRFKVRTTCGFVSGSRIGITSYAYNPCGKLTNYRFSPAPATKIKNLTPVFKSKINIAPFVINPCNNEQKTVNVGFNVLAGSSNTGAGDSIRVSLPLGLTYLAGTAMNVSNFPLGEPRIETVGTQQNLYWQIPNGLTAGTNTTFKFDVQGANNTEIECRTYELKAEAFRSQTATCITNNSVCNVRNSSSQVAQSVTFKKPDLKFTNFQATATALPPNQEQVDYAYTLQNDGEAVPVGTSMSVDIYADNGNGELDAGDMLLFTKTTTSGINAGGQTVISGTATVPSGKTCNLLAVISASTCNCQKNVKSLIATPDLKFNSPKDVTVCSGGTVAVGYLPLANVAYQWSSFQGSNTALLSATNTSPVNFTTTNASTSPITVKYFLKSIRNSGQCYAIDTINIKVEPAIYDSIPFTACLNSPFNLAGPTGNTNYQWTPTTNLTPSATIANPSVTIISNSIKYKLTYKTPSGCTGVYVADIKAIACAVTELGNFVYYDKNYNGVQDAGEPGVQGVTVLLYKANDLTTPIMTTMTNATGFYLFGNIPPGEYVVKFIPPTTAILTKQDQGGDDALDSDANPTTGFSQSVYVSAGQTNYTLDAGIVYPDWGDAPNTYKTDLATDGPRHLMIPNLKLGANIDTETNGAPATTGALATGDDSMGTPDDEDAIASFPAISVHKAGQTVTVNVTTTNNTGAAAQMIVWIDFDRNGTFDADEGVLANVPNGSTNAIIPVTFTVPNDVDAGITYARVRLANSGLSTASAGGLVASGEVEDYNLIIDCENLSFTPTLINVCSGATIASISANTNSTRTNAVKFVYYTAPQTGAGMYSGGTALGTVTPSGGVATLSNINLPLNTGVSPVDYYIYAILNPNSPNCKPFAEYRVKVNPLPTASIFNPKPTICFGEQVTLEATGGDTYAWSNGDNAAIIDVEPATTTTYTVTATNIYGCSGTAQTTITVNQLPVLTTPLNTTVCSDVASALNLTTSGTVAAANYNITALTIPTGLTASAGSPAVASAQAANVIANDAYTNKTLNDLTVIYTVQPVSSAGCIGVANTVNVTVRPEPVLATGLNKTVCSDVVSAINLGTASGGIAAANYDITQITNSGLTASAGSPAVANGQPSTVLSDDAWTNKTAANVNVTYRVRAVGTNTCQGDLTNVVLTVQPEPTLANNLNKTICSDAATGVTLAVASGSAAASTYNITAINMNGLTPNAGSPAVGNGLAANVIADDAYINNTSAAINVVYTIVPVSANGCQGDPLNVTITVNPKPIFVSGLDKTVCSDVASAITFNTAAGSVAASTYNITAINMNGLTASAGSPAVGNGLAANIIADDAYTNKTTADVNVIYTVRPVSAAGCVGDAMNVTLTVRPEPILASGLDKIVCSKTPSAITLSSNASAVAASTYNITAINQNGLTAFAGSPATGNGLAANVIADDAFTNTTTSAKNVIYTIVPVSSAGCLGDAVNVTLTVNPEPVGVAQNLNACSAVPLDINPQTAITNSQTSTFSWKVTAISPFLTGAAVNDMGTGNIQHTLENFVTTPQSATYSITPTSAAGCVGTPYNIKVTVYGIPNASATPNGSLDLCTGTSRVVSGSAFGSNTPFTHQWQIINQTNATGTLNGAATANVQSPTFIGTLNAGQTSGTITLRYTATDSKGCKATDEITFNIGNTAPKKIVMGANSPCAGSVEVYSIPATAGNTYNWQVLSGGTVTGGGTSNTVTVSWSNVAGGPHVVCVKETDANGCTQRDSALVTIKANPTVTVTAPTVCATKTLNLTALPNAGVTPYTYNWTGVNSFTSSVQNPSITNATTSNSGTYNLTVTDANGCKVITSVNATVLPQPIGTATSNSPVCEGNTLNLTASGGSLYSWSGPNTFVSSSATPNISNVTASNTGTYNVTITDVDGCSATRTTSVVINPRPAAITINGDLTPCANSTLTYSVVSSVAGHTYTWSVPSGGTLLSSPTANTVTVSWVATGNHTVKVTATDGNGCTRDNIFNVSIVQNPSVTATSNTPCLGKNLNLTATPTGGTAPYTYNWAGVNGFTNTTQNPSIANVTASNAGTYNVTVTDVNGCTSVASTNVTINPLPNATATSNTPICEGQTAIFTATGGTSYAWSGPNTFTSSAQNPTIANATPSIAGTYSVTVTDANTCSIVKTTTLVVNTKPTALSIAGNNTPCANSISSYSVTPNAGNTYVWSLASGGTLLSSPTANAVTVSWANTGTHILKVTETNSNGCTFENTLNITISPLPTTTTSATAPCSGGTLNLTTSPSGGTAPYTYNWAGPNTFTSTLQNPSIAGATAANNGTYNVTVTDAKGCTVVSSTNVNVSNLPTGVANSNSPVCEGNAINLTVQTTQALSSTYNWSGPNGFTSSAQNPSIANAMPSMSGTYNVTISNTSGCSQTASTSVVVNAKPAALSFTGDDTPCANSILTYSIVPNAGSTYVWSLPSGGTLLSSPTGTTMNVQWATSGTHQLKVTENDANGCVRENILNIVIKELPVVTASVNTPCSGKDLNLTSNVNSGLAPYNYNWSGVNSFSNITQNPTITNVTTANAGTYNLTVTDTNGCTSTTSVNATIYGLPTGIAANSGPVCVGANANLSASGGTSYVWSGVSGFTSSVQNPVLTNVQSSNAGTYSVTISDANACSVVRTTTLVVNTNPATLTISGDNTPCANSTLSYNVTPVAGNTIVWTLPSGGTFASSTTATPVSVNWASTGSHTLGVKEMNPSTGCMTQSNLNVTIQPNPSASVVGSSTCSGGDLLLKSNPTGGTPTYTYNWTGPNTFTSSVENPLISPASDPTNSGVYAVTVTDNQGCTATSSANITVGALPTGSVSSNSPICEGSTLNLRATGGTTYNWVGPNGFASTSDIPSITNITPSASGTYTVTITNASCSTVLNTSVVINAKPVPLAINGDATPCAGSTLNYSITPTAGHSYTWSLPSGGTLVSNPNAANVDVQFANLTGSHTIRVTETDANGCSTMSTMSIFIIGKPSVIAAVNTPCVGKDLNLTSSATGGQSPYIYNWSGPNSFAINNMKDVTISNAQSFNGGIYTVTVTDLNGCTAAASANAIINALPSAMIASNTPICETATLNFSATGGNSYSWSGVNGFLATGATPSISNTTPSASGTYSVTVTNTQGCTAVEMTTIVVNPKPSILTINGKNTPCANATEAYNITPNAGSTYVWSISSGGTLLSSPSANAVTVSWAGTGAHTVKVTETDANGCTQESTLSIMIKPNPTISAAASAPCNGNDLNLTSTPNGGTTPYTTYAWTGPNTFTSSVQNPTIVGATNANNGIYNVTVTDTNNCTATASVNANINNLPTGAANNNGPICEQQTLNLTASGGTSYKWAGPNSFTSTSASPSINSATLANAGTYSVTISDANACTTVLTTTVTINAKPSILTIVGNIKPCANGTYNYSITPTAGSTYAWSISSGGTMLSVSGDNIDILWASSGTHTVRVTETNAAGCTQESTLSATIQGVPTLTAAANTPCVGKNLNLTATPTGGNTPYTYSWAGVNSFTNTAQNPIISNVTASNAGTYNVTVTDINGCTAVASANAVVNPLPTPTATNNGAICEGAILNLNVTPSAASYNWSGVNGFTSTVQNPSLVNATPSMSGVYDVTVTDANGCSATTNTTATVNAKPSVLTINGNILPCANGIYTYSITPNAGSTYNWSLLSGGTLLTPPNAANVQVQWANAGTPVLKITETNAAGCTQESTISPMIQSVPTAVASANTPCTDKTLNLNVAASGGTTPYTYNWSGVNSFSNTTQNPSIANATSANAGTYNVTVTDVNGCTAITSTTAGVNPSPTITVSNNITICETSNINLTATGGTNYAWSGPNGFTAATANTGINNATPSASGVYNVTVTDANTCTATGAMNVTVNPKPATIAILGNNTPCANSTNTYMVTQTAGSSYVWNIPTGATVLSSLNANSVDVLWSVNGTHTVEVTETDANGCVRENLLSITIKPNPTIVAAATKPCNGTNLNLSATVSNGITPYTNYSWEGPNAFTSNVQNPSIANATNASVGTYSVTVTDSNNCSAVASVNADINNLPIGEVSNNSPVCQGSTVQFNVVGGQTYQWSGPNSFASTSSSPSIANATTLNSGKYFVTIYDSNGCQSKDSTTVVVNAKPLTISILGDDTPCLNATNLYYIVEKAGSSYSWSLLSGGSFTSNPNTDSVMINWTNLGTHQIKVTETDANGCAQESIFTASPKTNPTVVAAANTPCVNKTLNLTSTVANGTAPYTYNWSGVSSFTSTAENPNINNAFAAQNGAYTVTVTDANSCSAISTVNATVNPSPNAIATSNGTICENETINLSATGGSTYSWLGPNAFTSSSATPNIPNATAINQGNYSVTVTDANSCTIVLNTSVLVNAKPATLTIGGNISPCANSIHDYFITEKIGSTYTWSLPSGGIFITNPSSDSVKVQWTNVGNHTLHVTETDVNGCTKESTLNISIKEIPSVTLSATTPCNGKDLILTATPNGGTPNYTYNWTGVNSFTSTTQSPTITNATNANNGTYNITVTDNFGCKITNSINANINDLPIGEAIGNSPVCESEAVNLSAIGGTFYAWSGPNGFTSTSANNTITNATLAHGGDYYVTISDTKGCQIIDTVAIVINPKPSILTINGNVKPCLSGISTYYVPNVAGYTYNWSLTSGGVFASAINKDSVQVQWTNTGVHVLKVTYTNANGCTQQSTISPDIQRPMTIVAASTAPCALKDLELSSNVTGGTAPHTFTWSGPNTYAATGQNQTIIAAPTTAAGTYFVTVTDVNGCKAVTSTTAGVKPLPNGTVNADIVTCSGGTINLQATGGVSYDWSGPNGFTSMLNAFSINNVNSSQSGVYAVTITDNQGCSIVKTTNVTINVNLAPTPIYGDNTPCAYSINEYYYEGVAGHTYNWTVLSGGVIFSNPNNDTIKVKWNGEGNHSIRLVDTDANGCVGTNILDVNVKSLPIVKASATAPCSGSDVNLSALATNGTPNYSFAWSGVNTFNSTLQNPVIANATSANNGFYKVIVTDANACQAKDSVNINTNTLPTGAVTNDGPLCEGKTLHLSAVGGLNYQWSGPNGFTSTFAQPTIPNVTLANAGEYSVTISNSNCAVSARTLVVITKGNNPITIFGNHNPCQNAENQYFIAKETGHTYVWTLQSGGQFLTLPTKDTVDILWSNSGNHVLKITDTNADGCSTTTEFNVSIQPRPTLSVAANNPCLDDDLTLTTTTDGGVSPYTYTWKKGATSLSETTNILTISPATLADAGIYNVTVTDTKGCSATASTNATVKPLPNGTISASSPVCVGSNVTLTATGGTSYAWSGPRSFTANTNIAVVNDVKTNNSGVYNVTITDNNACTLVLNKTITVNQNPVTNAIQGDITPCASNIYTYFITKKIGMTYSWTLSSGGVFISQTDKDSVQVNWSNVASGPHTISLIETDANGCFTTNKTNVTIVPQIKVLAQSGTSICGGNQVNLAASTSSGTTPFNFSWTSTTGFISSAQNPSLGAASPTLEGTYYVSVTDANGCISTDSTKVLIKNLPTGTIASNGPVCKGNTLNLTATGGVLYSWAGPNGFTSLQQNPNRFSVDTTMSGTYSVTITDLNNCSIVKTIDVTVTNPPLKLTVFGKNTPCANSVEKYFITEKIGHTYIWSLATGGTIVSSPSNDTISVQWNANAGGPHFLKVLETDANGCSTESVLNINTQPSPSVLAGNNGPICTNENITLTSGASGGVSPYTFEWFKNTTSIGTTKDVVLNNANASQSGVYTVIASDVNGCTASSNTTITVNPLPTVVASSNEPVCETSTIKLFATGGVLYNWTGVNGFVSNLQNPEIANANATKVGQYSVTVTDANGCKNSGNITVNLAPAMIPISVTGKQTVCAASTEVYQVVSPQAGHTYTWSLPSGGTLLSNPVASSVTVSWSNVVTGAAQTLHVLDEISTGCKLDNTYSVTIVNNPSIVASNSGPICATNELFLNSTTSNGTAPYTYNWTGVNAFTSTAENPIINPSSTANNGRYNLTVTDANGCQSTNYTDVDVTNLPSGGATNSGTTCQGKNVTLDASGGLNYSWTGPNGFTSAFQSPIITNLNASKTGVYNVTITGVGGCTTVKTTTVTMNATTPSLAIIGKNNPCANSTERYKASYTAPNNFVWTLLSGGNIVSSTTTDEIDIQWLGSAGGPHLLIFTEIENTGCSRNDTLKINIQPIPTTTAANSGNVCEGGTINFSASGLATDNYTWAGTNGFTSNIQNPILTHVTPSISGVYNVTVTNVDGCTATSSTFVTVYEKPIVEAGIDQEICIGQQSANLSAIATKAFGSVSYVWNDAAVINTKTVAPTTTTTYYVSITDAHGCKANDSVKVTVLTLPTVYAGKDTAICRNQMSVTLNATSTSGNGGNNFAWSNNVLGASQLISPTNTINYTVTVTDQKGCFAKDTVKVTVWDVPTTNLGVDTAICLQQQNVLLDAKTTGGTGIYTYKWNDFLTTKTRLESPIVETLYSVTATDTHGCYATDERIIRVNPIPFLISTPDTKVCQGSEIQLSTDASAGDASTLKFLWSNGKTTKIQTVGINASTDFYVTVTDAKGCLAKDTVKITAIVPPSAGIADTTLTPLCQTDNSNIINLLDYLKDEVNGGTWTFISTTSLVTPTVTTALNGNNLDTKGFYPGTYKFRYTAPIENPCAADTEDINFKVEVCCKPVVCPPVKITKRQ
jgi:SdrD B-like domain/GEVED domain/PKD-like domain